MDEAKVKAKMDAVIDFILNQKLKERTAWQK